SAGARTLDRRPLPELLAAGRPVVLTHVSPQEELAQADLFEPVLSVIVVASADEALQLNAACPYALGATVFGSPKSAHAFARRIDTGCVVINDMIAPTADPRISFGGRKQSGFGVTRGAAGLEAMTQIKTIVHQRSRWKPHLDTPSPYDAGLLHGFLQACHGGSWGERWAGIQRAIRAGMAQRKWKQTKLGLAPLTTDLEQTESMTCPTNESRSSAAA
ncbi:MAG: aldehyde dehydrogenase family protein, partial [Planctomycetota bacterium]